MSVSDDYSEQSTDQEKVGVEVSYRELIGSMMYILVTRPEISYSISKLSESLNCPSKKHWTGAKKILRYLKGTKSFGLVLSGGRSLKLLGYADSDWATGKVDRKSISGYVFLFGESLVRCSSKKQTVVALSSMEAEYIALSSSTQEGIWLRNLLTSISFPPNDPTTIKQDNQATITFSETNKISQRSKHIDVRHYFVKQAIEESQIMLEYIPSKENLADIFTKPLGKEQFEYLRTKLGVTQRQTENQINLELSGGVGRINEVVPK